MKHHLLLLVTICLFASSSMAQSKIDFGITAEGSWFMPEKYSNDAPPNKDGFGTGIGVYASRNLYRKLSADLSLIYRRKEMREYEVPGNGGYNPYFGYSGYSGYDPESIYAYSGGYNMEDNLRKYELDYIVLPLHLSYPVYKYIFLRGGVEASWLANYNAINAKTEFNWTIGIEYQKYKLKGSLNYIRGCKDVAFFNDNIYSGTPRSTVYRNSLIQLNFAYPLWQK